MIIGNYEKNGLDIIKNLTSWADEIIFSIAFIKKSGWSQISKKIGRGKKITIITGENFYQTEPDLLLNMFEAKYDLYLYQKKSPTFHPKIYLFKKGKKTKILLGSANLTKSGLSDNYEVSILIDGNKNEKEVKRIIQLIDEYLIDESFTKINSYSEIEGYRVRYEEYHKVLSKAKKEIKGKLKKIPIFKIEPLLKFSKENRSMLLDEIEEKNIIYARIKKKLDFIVKSKIKSKIEFSEKFDEILSSFYSSGLHRNKNDYYPKFKSVVKLLRYIKKNVDEDISQHYNYLTNQIKNLNGFSLNVMTEILNTFYPNLYPVLNTRVLKVMNSLGLINKKNVSQIKLADYERYIKIITEIRIKAKLNNYREVDFVISKYYSEKVK